MYRKEAEKLALHNRLTNDLSEVDNGYARVKQILKSNTKCIRDLRDDIDRWKETCFRQSERIHKLYLISAIQFLTIIGLIGWVSILLIFH